MIWAAVSGLTTTNTMQLVTVNSQTSNGSRIMLMPLQRMQSTVATILIAVAVVPIPLSKIESVQ